MVDLLLLPDVGYDRFDLIREKRVPGTYVQAMDSSYSYEYPSLAA